MLRRLFNLTGGFLENYHSVSNGNTMAATPYTYGTAASGSTLDTGKYAAGDPVGT